jgi:transposase-like protein
MRNALSCVPKRQQSIFAAALRQAFLQPDRAAATQTLRHVSDRFRQNWRQKLADFIDDSEMDVLSHMDFPVQHRAKLHRTSFLKRLNKAVKRRGDVVGIFLSEGAIVRLIGAVLLEQNDEWLLSSDTATCSSRRWPNSPRPPRAHRRRAQPDHGRCRLIHNRLVTHAKTPA